MPRPLFTPVPILQEAGWAPGPVWTGAENLAPPGFDPRTVQPVASRYTDIKETRGYWKLKEEAADRTLWGTCFGRGCGPFVGQTAE